MNKKIVPIHSHKNIVVNKRENNKLVSTPRVISLFSGCGGLDLGFHNAGYKIVYANDIDKSLGETYKANLGDIVIDDIANIDKNSIPDADVVLAGIPCQPFSNAGKRGSVNDLRGNLFNQVIATLQVKKPKIVIFENVRGFLSSKDENGEFMPERIRKELKNVDGFGYELYYKLLNASDYGVPQNRYRVIMIGIRKDIDKGFTFPDPITDKKKLKIKYVLEKPLPKGETVEVWELSPQSKKLITFIPEGGSWKSIPPGELPPRLIKIKEQIKRYRSPNFYRRFSREEIMGTITAAGTPENSGIVHPTENRRYSVREVARFQSFPDSFKFVGASVRQKYKMIGNAVPVNLAYNIARSIKEQYFS